MELLAPSILLIIWTIICLLSLILMIIALISLARNTRLNSTEKLMWAVIIIFVPTIGSILFLTIGRPRKNIPDVH